MTYAGVIHSFVRDMPKRIEASTQSESRCCCRVDPDRRPCQ